jgi:tetratricopeptide (TPR) repeat protein/TolB-like protein
VTREGTTLGTAAYMSPEQARGSDVDPRTDVWALGVTLYEMLTGSLPFRAEHDTALIYGIINEPHEPVAAIRPETPEKLARVVDRALAKDPGERYGDAGQMARDLEEVARDLGDRARRASASGNDGGSSIRRRARIWAPVAVAVLAAVAAFVLKPMFFGDGAISAPRPVAVISFENQTGDSDLDYLREVIPNLLITKLEQSKHLSVVSWERMRDLLVQAGHGNEKLIDRELGFEVCRLDGIDTVVLGSFTMAGDVFVTDVKVLDARSKELLKSASAKGEGVGSILAKQIDELGGEISRGIGMSERSIAVDGHPISDVTTRSMDAYHYFVTGREEYNNRYPADALQSLRKAVALDSTFAVAWLYLGRTYRSLRDFGASDSAYTKANKLAASAPEKDRLYIEAIYANVIEKNKERYLDLLDTLVRRYPKEKLAHLQMGVYMDSENRLEEAIASFKMALALDPEYGDALNGLGYVYAKLEDFPAAIEYLERYAEVSPGDVNPVDSMAEMYFRMGDLDQAIELYKQALRIRPDSGAPGRIAYITALKEDYAGAIDWCDRFIDEAPSLGLRGSGNMIKSFYGVVGCRPNEAIKSTGQAMAIFEQMEHWYGLSGTWWMEGWVNLGMGKFEEARRCFVESSKLFERHEAYSPWIQSVFEFALGSVDLKAAEPAAARMRFDAMKKLIPDISQQDRAHRRMALNNELYFEGEILLAEGRFDDAIAVCGGLSEVGIPTITSADILFYNFPTERDVVARAHVAKGAVDKAIDEYERLTTFDPSSKDRRLIFPLFHYRLGRLYEEREMTDKAVSEYRKFVDIMAGVEPMPLEAADVAHRLERLSQTD